MSLLGLPPIPAELRAAQPYLQRAEELKAKEPVMAYWCAYYAAQIGIHIKAKEAPARDLLYILLTKLEQMKSDVGPTDAIDQESASSAYVENFALRVFALADNEDRKGMSTRSTAKKFLAAANFLEVLKIFPKVDVSDSNDEKIRYAKWKAADIAKSFREGRKPMPGPAGHDEGTPDALSELSLPGVPTSDFSPSGHSSSSSTLADDSPPGKSSGHKRKSSLSASPPKPKGGINLNDGLPSTPPRKPKPPVDISGSLGVTGIWGVEEATSPGTWSTAATPGTANPTPASQFGNYAPVDYGSPSVLAKRKKEEKRERRSSSQDSEGSDQSGSLKSSFKSNGNANAKALGLPANRSVRWTPSVEGGLSSVGGSPPVSPDYDDFQDNRQYMDLPPGFVPLSNNPVGWNSIPPAASGAATPQAAPPPQIYVNNNSPPQPPPTNQIYAPAQPQPKQPQPNHPPQIYAPPPPPNANSVSPQPAAPSAPPQIYAAAANTPSPPQNYPPSQLQPSAPPAPQEFELNPTIIAKAQKHARFAISSLDYEDAESARRELRAALAILGG